MYVANLSHTRCVQQPQRALLEVHTKSILLKATDTGSEKLWFTRCELVNSLSDGILQRSRRLLICLALWSDTGYGGTRTGTIGQMSKVAMLRIDFGRKKRGVQRVTKGEETEKGDANVATECAGSSAGT